MNEKKPKRQPLRAEDFFGLTPLPRGEAGGIWHSFLQLLRRGAPHSQRPDDEVEKDVLVELACHPALDGSRILSQVEHGEVTLTGFVSDRWSRQIAEQTVEKVRGVRRVHNRLEVQGWKDRQSHSA